MDDGDKTKEQLLIELEELQRQLAESKAQEALRESEQRLAEIIDFLPDATFAVDKAGNVIAWNRAIEEMTGIKAFDMLGKGDHEYSLPFYGARRPILIDLVFKSDEEIEKKYSFVTKEGNALLAEALVPVRGVMRALWGKAGPLYDSRGNIAGAIESIRDITGRKQAEEYLKQSEKKFATAFLKNSIPVAISTVREGRYIEVSEAFLKLIGLERNEVVGNTSTGIGFITPEQRQIILNEFRQKGSVINLELQIQTKGRGLSYGLFNSVKIAFSNEDYLLTVVTDITERKQADEALREAHDKLEQRVKERTADLKAANEDLKKFTYIASHDLRAPLINLKGFARELRMSMEKIHSSVEELLPSLDAKKGEEVRVAIHEDVPEALEFIETSVARMDNLINSILKLSRVGSRDLTLEPINMTDLVDDILKNLAHQLETRQARVFVESLPEVTADRISMQQIMGNLLENAVKYLAPDRAGEIRIRGEEGDEFITFHIQDNGRGIVEKDILKIFDIFSRVGAQDVPGEGMGLTYVQAMVKRHGGHIRCESEPGAGTTFTFTISKKISKGEDYER